MYKFQLEQFDSRNTSVTSNMLVKHTLSAISIVKRLSEKNEHPIILHSLKTGGWVKYEKGIRTEWSMAIL